jgi:hypothetical protein
LSNFGRDSTWKLYYSSLSVTFIIPKYNFMGGGGTRSHIVQNSTLVKEIQMLHVSIIVYGTFLRNIIHDTSPASK